MTGLSLATGSAGFEQRVRRAFAGSLNGQLHRPARDFAGGDTRSMVIDLTAQDVAVVAIGPDIGNEIALELARELDETCPEISVVIVTRPSPEIWEEALRAGVRDVVAADASDEELRAALERAFQTADRRRRNLVGAGGDGGASGRVITVVAPKGGSGKTAIATNLGVGLSRIAPAQVALVDLDLQFGDVTPTLELKPEHTIADVLRAPGPVDITALKVFLTKRTPGFFVLPAPNTPAEGEQIGEAIVHRSIALLADEFSYVVVDTAAGLTEHTLAALELSTDVVLVCDLSVAAVRGMKKVVDALDQLEMTFQRHFVLNRADSRVGMELAEVATVVGYPVDIKLPSSRAVPTSMNQGTPLVELNPRAAFSRRISDLVYRLVPEEARPRRLFARR